MANRSKRVVKWEELKGMVAFDASAIACALLLDMSVATLERKILEEFGETFDEYKQKYLAKTALRLKTKMINKALTTGDNVALIFCLKNIGGWADKVENSITQDEGKVFKLNLFTMYFA